jgi:ATP-binding protein involved in chromosome partitioning
MSRLSEAHVREILAGIDDPNANADLVSLGWVRGVGIDGDRVSVDLRAGYPLQGIREELAADIAGRLEADALIDKAVVNLDWKVVAHAVQGDLKPLEQIRNIIAVASGKGGVGKSATAVNLALGLQADGARVGVLDADIYGPSMPRMLGVRGQPQTVGNRIVPQQAHGLQVMSIGFMVEEDTPMIWRGPMVTSALQQLLTETNWESLDYLVVDLPPGTGDIQLTLAQRVPVSGCLVVTTPQDIALLDARKAVQMFRKVEMSVLGIVENMSTHIEHAHLRPVRTRGADFRVGRWRVDGRAVRRAPAGAIAAGPADPRGPGPRPANRGVRAGFGADRTLSRRRP